MHMSLKPSRAGFLVAPTAALIAGCGLFIQNRAGLATVSPNCGPPPGYPISGPTPTPCGPPALSAVVIKAPSKVGDQFQISGITSLTSPIEIWILPHLDPTKSWQSQGVMIATASVGTSGAFSYQATLQGHYTSKSADLTVGGGDEFLVGADENYQGLAISLK